MFQRLRGRDESEIAEDSRRLAASRVKVTGPGAPGRKARRPHRRHRQFGKIDRHGAAWAHIGRPIGTTYARVLANTINSLVTTLYKRMKQAGKVDYVVFEAGAFGVDTMRPMAKCCSRHVAVVTMVRLEHFASFRTVENVAREKRAWSKRCGRTAWPSSMPTIPSWPAWLSAPDALESSPSARQNRPTIVFTTSTPPIRIG